MGSVFVQGAGTTLEANDILILDTRARDDGQFGRGLVVQDGASAVVRRAVIAQNLETGILVSGRAAAASLRLEDVEVRDTAPQQSDGEGGRGLSAQYEVGLELERVRVARCHGVGLHVAGRDGSNPTASLIDVSVSDVAPEIDQGVRDQYGRGLQIEVGAVATGQRIRVERAHEAGVVVFEAMATLGELAVLDTLARASDDTIGRGLVVQGGAVLTLEGALVELTRDVGIYVSNPASRLSAHRLTLRDARARGCADGACVQVDGYVIDRLSDDVRYQDNGTNLEATSLPVPDPIQDPAL